MDKILNYFYDEPKRFVFIMCMILGLLKVLKDYYLQQFVPFDIVWIVILFFITKWLGIFKDD